MIRKVEMERFTVISARPFDEVVAAIKTSIGNPNMEEVGAKGEICRRIRFLSVAKLASAPEIRDFGGRPL